MYDQLLDLAKLLECLREVRLLKLKRAIMDIAAVVATSVEFERCHPTSDEPLIKDLFFTPNFEQVLHKRNEPLLAQSTVDPGNLCVQVIHHIWHLKLKRSFVGPCCCDLGAVE